MDSVLSGYSQNYGGNQIAQGYAGTVSTAGSATSGSAQGVDVTQLQPGDTFQGEIVSVNGEDVQIQLANGQYMAAKLERDVQLALGQVMNLQVQSNKDNRVVLKPVYDGKMQMLRVGEAALRAAHMAVNDRTMSLVSTLLENGMPINKNTLMLFNRLTLQNPNASMADLIKLSKLQLPINDNSLSQLQSYQKSEHKLLDGIREASDEILKLYDTLTGKTEMQGGQNLSGNGIMNAAQSIITGQTALENGSKFLERVLLLLSGEEAQSANTQNSGYEHNNINNTVLQENQGAQTSENIQSNADKNIRNSVLNPAENLDSETKRTTSLQEQTDKVSQNAEQAFKQEGATESKMNSSYDAFYHQLKNEPLKTVPNRIILFIKQYLIQHECY